MGRLAVPRAVRRLVRDRSGNRCEYCLHPASYASGPFVCEHVRPRVHGAGNTPTELAWACSECNSHGRTLSLRGAGSDEAISVRK